MQLLKIFSIIIILISTGEISAQKWHPIVGDFEARQVGNNVQLDFTIMGGASCNGIQLQRSPDSLNYIQIGQISGICGGEEFTVSYTLTDGEPKSNAINYYRLILGQQGPSAALPFEFFELRDGISLFPNPSSSKLRIRFDNPTAEFFILSVYDNTGKIIFSSTKTSSNQIDLNVSYWSSGIYHYSLEGESGGEFRGKFVVSSHP